MTGAGTADEAVPAPAVRPGRPVPSSSGPAGRAGTADLPSTVTEALGSTRRTVGIPREGPQATP
ncbi:hypothetical protein C6376_35620 [Streptomyces sp. P3]|nr:hypothetical protein C6376_35620 [Streptomyces sp. P3]